MRHSVAQGIGFFRRRGYSKRAQRNVAGRAGVGVVTKANRSSQQCRILRRWGVSWCKCVTWLSLPITRGLCPEAQVGFYQRFDRRLCGARIPHKVAMEFMLLGQDLSASGPTRLRMVNKRLSRSVAARLRSVRSNPGTERTTCRFNDQTIRC